MCLSILQLGLFSYNAGTGVVVDEKKTRHYYELGAMKGCVKARNNLACTESRAGNNHQAMKHFVILACAGCEESLDADKKGFMKGYVTKDQYANTLRTYQKSQDEMKINTRDKARVI